jgi:hypothetical protein
MASPTTSHPHTAKVPSRGTPVKQRILELLAEFFCLRTKDTAGLLRNRELTESDERSVRRTLSILHRDGLVCRLDMAYGGACKHFVYGLTDKGVSHAFDDGYSTAATKTLDEHSLRTLDHELEITSFHIALHRLCGQHGLRYAWRQTDLKHTIHPDALFTIEDPANPDRDFAYFLEIERSKFGNYRDGEPQILRKLGAFYQYFNTTDCEKEWGFRLYRVVVVQRTEARRDGLLAALRETYNHRMFFLTTEEAYRENMAGPIFRTPMDYSHTTSLYSALPRIRNKEIGKVLAHVSGILAENPQEK